MKFWFHYNKPASKARQCNVLTIHYLGACHLVTGIDCQVPIVTKARTRQPRCVMAGEADIIEIRDDIAFIRSKPRFFP
jgi:hypothetical protein